MVSRPSLMHKQGMLISSPLLDMRARMDEEVKKTFDEVTALREQKKALQGDLADLLAFKSKVSGRHGHAPERSLMRCFRS